MSVPKNQIISDETCCNVDRILRKNAMQCNGKQNGIRPGMVWDGDDDAEWQNQTGKRTLEAGARTTNCIFCPRASKLVFCLLSWHTLLVYVVISHFYCYCYFCA